MWLILTTAVTANESTSVTTRKRGHGEQLASTKRECDLRSSDSIGTSISALDLLASRLFGIYDGDPSRSVVQKLHMDQTSSQDEELVELATACHPQDPGGAP